jgi:hypothetical protein
MYGQQFTVEGEFLGLETLAGDRPYEIGFRILERGTDHLSCVAFTVRLWKTRLRKCLHMNDRVRITGKAISPSTSEEPRLRRSQAFFVALAIERL